MCVTLLCSAETRREKGIVTQRNLNISTSTDQIFRFFYLFDRESCAQTETHTRTHIYIYSFIKKKSIPRKKGTFSRGRNKAGAKAPFDVYVCTCLVTRPVSVSNQRCGLLLKAARDVITLVTVKWWGLKVSVSMLMLIAAMLCMQTCQFQALQWQGFCRGKVTFWALPCTDICFPPAQQCLDICPCAPVLINYKHVL